MGLGVETNTSPSGEVPVETNVKEWVVGPPVARTYVEGDRTVTYLGASQVTEVISQVEGWKQGSTHYLLHLIFKEFYRSIIKYCLLV